MTANATKSSAPSFFRPYRDLWCCVASTAPLKRWAIVGRPYRDCRRLFSWVSVIDFGGNRENPFAMFLEEECSTSLPFGPKSTIQQFQNPPALRSSLRGFAEDGE
jgi:hypothetical protein